LPEETAPSDPPEPRRYAVIDEDLPELLRKAGLPKPIARLRR
jgi:hypothetical protein